MVAQIKKILQQFQNWNCCLLFAILEFRHIDLVVLPPFYAILPRNLLKPQHLLEFELLAGDWAIIYCEFGINAQEAWDYGRF